MKHTRGVSVCAAIALTLAVTACHHHHNNSDDTVEASDWVRNTTPIASYRIDRGELNRVDLTLLDTEGDALGTLSVRNEPGHKNDDGTEDAIRADLKPDGGPPLTLYTHGLALSDGYATKMSLQSGNDQVRLRAEHRYQSCYVPVTPQPDQAIAPDCASPLSLEEPAYSLPSCGLPRYAMENGGIAAQLTRLTYIQDAPARESTRGARLFDSSGDVRQAQLDVLADGRITGAGDVDGWLRDTGADAIIGTDAEALLTAAFQDRAWRDYVEAKLIAESSPVASLFTTSCDHPGENRPLAAGCFGFDWLSDMLGLAASAKGDPHLQTVNGISYDFMGAGEYRLAKFTGGTSGVEVQARLEPLATPNTAAGPACQRVTYVSAVAMRVNGQTIAIYARPDFHVTVDGNPIADAGALAQALQPGVSVLYSKNPEEYTFILADGGRLTVKMMLRGTLTVSLLLPKAKPDDLEGLFRLVDASGNELSHPLSFDQLYNDFGENRRIKTSADSLFDYAPGESLADYFIPGFPSGPVRVSELHPAARQTAEQLCKEVEGEPGHTWCVLDTACTADNYAPVYLDQPAPQAVMTPAQRPVIVSGEIAYQEPESVAADDTYRATSCRLAGSTGNALFAEQRAYTLPDSVAVDITVPGEYTASSQLASGTIPAGKKVDVFFIHIPEPVPARLINSVATVRFSGEILGVAATPTALHNTDPPRSATSLGYPEANPERGLEFGADRLTISPDKQTIRIGLGAPGDVDQLRIFVAAP